MSKSGKGNRRNYREISLFSVIKEIYVGLLVEGVHRVTEKQIN